MLIELLVHVVGEDPYILKIHFNCNICFCDRLVYKFLITDLKSSSNNAE